MQEQVQYDVNIGKNYCYDGLLQGLINHTKFVEGSSGFGGFDDEDYDNSTYTVGTGNRSKVIQALGFSSNPTRAECDRAMKTITINAYPDKRICVHKDLVNEVQSIFNELKEAGVNLNKYIGGYCFRTINNPRQPNSKTLSMHSFGCAIDINYNLNPFVGGGKPLKTGDDTASGKIRTYNSPIVKAFARHGWGWGGRYGDYMHFSKANGG